MALRKRKAPLIGAILGRRLARAGKPAARHAVSKAKSGTAPARSSTAGGKRPRMTNTPVKSAPKKNSPQRKNATKGARLSKTTKRRPASVGKRTRSKTAVQFRNKKASRTRRVAGSPKKQARRQRQAHLPVRRPRTTKLTRPRRISDKRLQLALKFLQSGHGIPHAAREIGVTPKKLEEQLRVTGAARKRKGRWIVRSDLARQMLLFSTQGAFVVFPRDHRSASKGALFMGAVGRALMSNEPSEVETFVGKSLTDVHGRKWFFETDLDALYRLASIGEETFESVYRIVI